MISADRMKSVRIALLTSASSSAGPCVATAASCAWWPPPSGLPELLGALVAEVGAADHQQRGQQPRQQLAQCQRGRKDEQQLVAQRAGRDPPDHRQLALGLEALHVARGHGRVVDDHARGLRARAAGAGGDVVDRGGGRARERRDVVEQRGEARAHPVFTLMEAGSVGDRRPRRPEVTPACAVAGGSPTSNGPRR